MEVVDDQCTAVASQVSKAAQANARMRVTFLAADVPAVRYRVFYARAASAAQAAGVQVASGQGATVLENESLRVTIDMGNGCITHLVDKKTGFDSIAKGGCGNQLQAFHDNPEDYDAWNIDTGTLDHPIALDKADAVTVVEQRPRPSSRGIP